VELVDQRRMMRVRLLDRLARRVGEVECDGDDL
jgi:hypothetical protein